MLREVKLPEISENVESGEVIEVLVSVGDIVEKEQPLVEFETEKAAFEIPSPQAGRIEQINVKEGQTVKVGQVIAQIETEPETTPAAEVPTPPEPEGAPAAEPAEPAPTPESQAPQQPQAQAAPEEEKPVPAAAVEAPAAPSVRQLARELGLDLAEVSGTGPGGRITAEDVKKHARQAITEAGGPRRAAWRPGAPEERPLPDFSRWGPVERRPMSRTRRTIAANLTYGWAHTPQVTQYDEADVTELERFRRGQANTARDTGTRLSTTAILVKVAAAALKIFPQFNASFDPETDELILKHYFHIAVAVDTDRGLLVPVIRDADAKSLIELSAELADLAAKARNKTITPDEMQGGNFTVSNLGGLGGTNFSPVVNWPQVAILGASRVTPRPVFVDGDIEQRLILPLSLSYDHRVVDGADGTRFLRWVAQALEVPLLIAL